MEHSRLLKFFLPKRDINKMAEPVKVKFDYQDPENVEAEVPGAQKIRESQNADENVDLNGENGELSKVSEEQNFSLEPVIVVTKKETTLTKGDLKLQKVTVTEDISVNFQYLFKKQTKPGKTVTTQIQKFEYKY